MWPALGNPQATPEVRQKIVDGVLAEAGGHSVNELASERDAMLLGLLTVRAKYQDAGQPTAAARQPA
jgi:hypothetical protein